MGVFVNGMYVGHEIYPGVYAEERTGPSWMIRKENECGWPCRVGEIKGADLGGSWLATAWARSGDGPAASRRRCVIC